MSEQTALATSVSMSIDDIGRIGRMLALSGFFDADRDASVAIAQMSTKVLAGREMGFGPFASVNGIHIIKGKPAIGANLMAAAVKGHPQYDYRVRKMESEAVAIEFFEIVGGKRESIGTSEFTTEDAKKAGTQNMGKFPRNMLFARAMSNGVKWFCPDVFAGNTVYVPEELGAEVDEDTGEIVGEWTVQTPTGIDEAEQGYSEDDLPGSLDDVPEDSAAAMPHQVEQPTDPAWKKAHRRLNAVGGKMYGDNWESVRHKHVLPTYGVATSNAMTVEQLNEAADKIDAVFNAKQEKAKAA